MDVLLVVLAVAVIALTVALALALLRSRRLRERFGEEYERQRAQEGRWRAEAELAQREKRRGNLDIRPLDPEVRDRFVLSWRELQTRFVDAPAESVRAVERLLDEVMRARGYPVEDLDQRAADLSVDHPAVVEDYREGHRLAENRSEPDGTEELRAAMLRYRAVFDALVETGGSDRIDVRDEQAPRPIR